MDNKTTKDKTEGQDKRTIQIEADADIITMVKKECLWQAAVPQINDDERDETTARQYWELGWTLSETWLGQLVNMIPY